MNLNPTIYLFDEYYRREDRTNPSFNREVAGEARKRLVQLSRILERVIALEQEAQSTQLPLGMHEKGDNEAVDKTIYRLIEVGTELEFLTEAFYYFAFRLRRIIRGLPGLSGFECKGVRDVRNKLIEHPEGSDSNVYMLSFGYAGEQGPVIKAIRYDNQTDIYSDSGLFVNATELKENLERRLSQLGLDASG